MPLGGSIQNRIRQLEHENSIRPPGKKRSHKQIQAIAYSSSRRGKRGKRG